MRGRGLVRPGHLGMVAAEFAGLLFRATARPPQALTPSFMEELTSPPGADAYVFILENLNTIPHLEALMLLWNSRPLAWTSAELATRLYLPPEKAAELLADLARRWLVTESQGTPARFAYWSRSEDLDRMMQAVEVAYRGDLVRVSKLVHSRASSSVREFARAFRLKKEQE